MDQTQLEEKLKNLVDGLLMLSETDAPFEYYILEDSKDLLLNKETVATIAGKTTGDEIETETLEHFFRNMVRLNPEDSDERKKEAARFKELQEQLQQQLQDVKVYRAGNTSITIYILGKTDNGDIAGLRTLIVET
jgi:hypothetical protein